MVITSDETQIQMFANWPMSHAKRMTMTIGKILYHVVPYYVLTVNNSLTEQFNWLADCLMSSNVDLRRP